MNKLTKTITEETIKKAKTEIDEIERKRYSLPKVELKEIEVDTLIALAQGRKIKDIDLAIQRIDKCLTYYSIVHILMRKFEAFTMSHVMYKAIVMGIVKPSDVSGSED